MAPARRTTSSRQSADVRHDRVTGSHGHGGVTADRCHRRRVLPLPVGWSKLWQHRHDCVRLTLLRSAVASVNADDVDTGPVGLRAAPSTSVRRSSSGVEQRHFMTFMYCAALVDKLALQLSQIQLQTDVQPTTSTLNDDTNLLASLLPADSDKRYVSASCYKQLSDSTSCDKCSRHATDNGLHVDISHDRQLRTDEPQQTKSMISLLQWSCRIPRPVALPAAVPGGSSSANCSVVGQH